MVHGYMVYTERAETASVSRGTSHVKTSQRCILDGYSKRAIAEKATVTHLESHATRAQRVCPRAEKSAV